MNSKKISVLLFDLGFTLLNFEGDFHKAMDESYLTMADSLIHSGIKIERQAFAEKFDEIISEYYRNREIDLIERPVEENLKKTLAFFTIENTPLPILEDAVKSMYTFTEASWKIEPDTDETLTKLKEMGYRLAIISNASNVPDLNRLIDNHNLRHYFEMVVISAEEGIRKPDPAIFSRTLEKLAVKPENAVMIGDTLPADVLGARKAGIISVWITRRANRAENHKVKESIHPDYTIPDLASLVTLLPQIETST